MYLEETKDYALVDQIMLTKELFECSMPDNDLELAKQGKWTSKSDDWIYLLIKDKDHVLGVIRLKYATSVTLEFHWHLLPRFWGSGISDKVNELLEQYVVKNYKVIKLMSLVPAPCTHTLKAAGRVGYSIEGVLVKSELWRGDIVDLAIIAKFIGVKNG